MELRRRTSQRALAMKEHWRRRTVPSPAPRRPPATRSSSPGAARRLPHRPPAPLDLRDPQGPPTPPQPLATQGAEGWPWARPSRHTQSAREVSPQVGRAAAKGAVSLLLQGRTAAHRPTTLRAVPRSVPPQPLPPAPQPLAVAPPPKCPSEYDSERKPRANKRDPHCVTLQTSRKQRL